MKKILCLTFAIMCLSIFFIPIKPAVANAQQYAVITSDDAYIFSDTELQNKLFIISKTYYVEVMNSSSDIYKIMTHAGDENYDSIVGYIDSKHVLICNKPDQQLSYSKQLLPSSNPNMYYSLQEGSSSTRILNDDVYFYGEIMHKEKLWYFVRYQDDVGYAAADGFASFEIENHPSYVEPEPPKPPIDENPTDPNIDVPSDGRDATIEIIMIAAITIPSIFIVFMFFFKKPTSKIAGDTYYRKDNPHNDDDY